MAKYYTVLVVFKGQHRWVPEYGSYEREEAQQELLLYRADPAVAQSKIVVTDHQQAAIEARIAQENGE